MLTYTPTNLIQPGEKVDLSDKENIAERQYGSKLVLVTVQMQMLTLWGVKGCLLFIYSRLT